MNTKVASPGKAVGVDPRLDFKVGETVVDPVHGIATVAGFSSSEVSGFKYECLVIDFQGRMTIRIPVAKLAAKNLRRIGDEAMVGSALKILSGKPKTMRCMWSRKVKIIQEKLNSGVMDLAAEVARDLHRGAGQEEPSYSQRQLYENALSRVVSEMAIVRNVTENQARAVVEAALAACPPTRRSRKATGEGDEAERMDEAA